MNMIDKLVARREALETEDGFSFLEMVIAGVLLGALAAGGVVGYGKVVENGHKQALAGAASQLNTAGYVALNDDDDATDVESVVTEFNASAGANSSLTAEEVAPVTTAGSETKGGITITNDKLTGADATKTVIFK